MMTENKMYTETMLVTPELAAEWLEKNHNNRPLIAANVDTLSRMLKEGRFELTHRLQSVGILHGAEHDV